VFGPQIPNSMASVGGAKSVLLWDMTTYKLLQRLNGHLHDVVSCDFSPDGALLVTASWDTCVILWDPYCGNVIRSFGHSFPPPRPIFASGANGKWVRAVAFSPEGTHLASVADDGFLRFWNVCDESRPEAIGAASDAMCCTYSPSGSILAVGHKQGIVSFWSVPPRTFSLQHLCRMVIHRHLKVPQLCKLNLPTRLDNYLRYDF